MFLENRPRDYHYFWDSGPNLVANFNLYIFGGQQLVGWLLIKKYKCGFKVMTRKYLGHRLKNLHNNRPSVCVFRHIPSCFIWNKLSPSFGVFFYCVQFLLELALMRYRLPRKSTLASTGALEATAPTVM